METFEINGNIYQEIPKEVSVKNKHSGSKMMSMLYPYAMLASMMYGGNQSQKAPKEVVCNIIEEFGLIELKKSKLSKSDRDWVVWKFNRHFKKVDK